MSAAHDVVSDSDKNFDKCLLPTNATLLMAAAHECCPLGCFLACLMTKVCPPLLPPPPPPPAAGGRAPRGVLVALEGAVEDWEDV